MDARRKVVGSLVVGLFVAFCLVAGYGSAARAQEGVEDAWASDDASLRLAESYLERMELRYTVDKTGKYPVLGVAMDCENSTHNMRIVFNAENRHLYIFLNRYIMAPADLPNLPVILRALMEKNWAMNFGKFEWDPSDGEVRLSFSFSTENGVGYEAFQAIVVTLFKTGDGYWPELSELTAEAQE